MKGDMQKALFHNSSHLGSFAPTAGKTLAVTLIENKKFLYCRPEFFPFKSLDVDEL